MIRSFGNKETGAIFAGRQVRRMPGEIQAAARRKLKQIDAAGVLDSLRIPPGNRLESLRGDLAGFHSIRINDQWRIVFRWEYGQAFDVAIKDYH